MGLPFENQKTPTTRPRPFGRDFLLILILCSCDSPAVFLELANGQWLGMVYAVDQDGKLLGIEKHEVRYDLPEPVIMKRDVTDPSEGVDRSAVFKFCVVPGETQQVRICAIYIENPVTATWDKGISLDASSYYSVLDEAPQQ